MKTKFRFKIVTQNKVKFKNFIFETPEFNIIPSRVHKNIGSEKELEFPEVSVESQLIEWMDGYDKKLFMIENNIDIILDYSLPIKKKTITFEDIVRSMQWHSLETLNIFIWTYSRIKPYIYKLKPLVQVELTTLIASLIIDGQLFVTKEHIELLEKHIEFLKQLNLKKLT